MTMQARTGAVIIITGAGSGIGKAVAQLALEEGYLVVLAGRRATELTLVAQDNANSLCVPTDVSDPEQVHNLFDRAVARFGRVDILFNNAGTFGPKASVDEVNLDEWTATLNVNVTGAMLCAAAAVRTMKAQSPQGGRIINNGSVSAHSPRPLSVAYTVSKHAITGLTKSIDLDGRNFGISCGQIDIGNTATELIAELVETHGALQPNGSIMVEPTFAVSEAARGVLLMAGLPSSVNIGQMVMTAAGMPFLGRG